MELRNRLTSGDVVAPVALGLVAAGLLLVPLAPGGAGDVVRIVVGLPFVLVLPGYVLGRALIPRESGCTPLERLCWTLALDMALVVAGALVLDLLPSGLTRANWVVFLTVALLVAGVVAHMRERGGGPRSVRTPRWPAPGRLAIAAVAILLAAGAIGLSVGTEETKAAPSFSQLWLVPDEPGPRGAAVPPVIARLGVHSYEAGPRQFRVEVRSGDDAPVQEWLVPLEPGQDWQQSVMVPVGTRTEAALYREGDQFPYRQVWMQP